MHTANPTSVNCSGRCHTAAHARKGAHAGPRGGPRPDPQNPENPVFLTDFWVFWPVRHARGILRPAASRTRSDSPCGWIFGPFMPETVIFGRSWPVCRGCFRHRQASLCCWKHEQALLCCCRAAAAPVELPQPLWGCHSVLVWFPRRGRCAGPGAGPGGTRQSLGPRGFTQDRYTALRWDHHAA